jgi:hypothetical protein
MRLRPFSAVLLPVVLAAWLPAELAASTFLARTVEELAVESEMVVEARVVDVRSFWNAERTMILTDAIVRVERAVAGGEPPPALRVRTFGGTVEDYTVVAHGFPVFARGERLVLFLHRLSGERTYRVAGYSQGELRIVEGADGTPWAQPLAVEGASFLHPKGGVAPAVRAVPLPWLEARVRAAIEAAGKAPPAASARAGDETP